MVTTPEMPETSLQLLRADSPALASLSRNLLSFAESLRQMQASLDMSGLSRNLLSFAEVQREMQASLDMSGLSRNLLSFAEAQRQMQASLNMSGATGLSQLISTMEGLRTLGQAQLATAAAAVEDAYATTFEDDVPDELVAELEDIVRDFAALQVIEYLPVKVSRRQLALYIGAVLMTSLMTVTFSSETADGIIGKFLELSGLVALVMVAAEKAHDRVTGSPTEANSGSPEDS
ncbi:MULTISPECIES: hypothetical protein [Streptomyces]|uniref:Uncharacterized protein n=1 Tax=Streptomyces liliiviolaceus TaxID=2823109 RepID=A0A940XSQ2_9ACTN|nr:hypothetical protein [Streptomyces liliiviolaceus]MBQ0847222.1 hypothetical protein [Streptomyces liliiviolaceus]